METNNNRLPSGLSALEIKNFTLSDKCRELLKQGYIPVQISNNGEFDQNLLKRINDEGFEYKISATNTENGIDVTVNILWILT